MYAIPTTTAVEFRPVELRLSDSIPALDQLATTHTSRGSAACQLKQQPSNT